MDDRDRQSILARRARFLAATLAATAASSLEACARQTEPEVCLSPPAIYVPEVEAGAEPPADDAAAEPDAGSQVETPPPDAPPPRICLSPYE